MAGERQEDGVLNRGAASVTDTASAAVRDTRGWTWRSRAPGETDYELLFGLLIVPLHALTGFVVTRLPAARVPRCSFHELTGLPCPGCGMVRCLTALSQGDWHHALRVQPLGFSVILLAMAYVLYSAVVVLLGKPRLRPVSNRHFGWRRAAWTAAVLVLANWIYLIAAGI